MVLTPEQTRQYLSERARPDRYVPNFADGGVVGQMPTVAPASGGSLAISVPVNIEGGGANKEEGDRIAQSLRAVIQSEIAQQLRQNGMISQILKRGR
jgi:phage-related minor tail protein